ncbi:MAG: hypothetical protein P8L31_04105 [Pseudomonadales bacterium]|nr:hypothetical protein [Pseudomonadales bacterium]
MGIISHFDWLGRWYSCDLYTALYRMNANSQISDSTRHKLLTGSMYGLVVCIILLGWFNADLNYLRARDGLGYGLGIAGTTLMTLLLLYPMRKRMKAFSGWGSVKYWFRTHMVFGVVGPVLIIFHSNFDLGSLNSRIALFCTLIVAGSGIVGRYLYAKLHYGLYGQSASLVSLRGDMTSIRDGDTAIAKLLPTINSELNEWEDRVLVANSGFFSSLVHAATLEVSSRLRAYRVVRQARSSLHQLSQMSELVGEHEKRLWQNVRRHVHQRASLLRKFAQFRTFERLFSLWHIVHYPLFILLVLAAVVHIVAVHMY